MAGVVAFSLAWPPAWGILVAVLVTLFGATVATSLSGPNMAAVGVSPDDELLVRPVGLVRLWAFHKGIKVPVSAITDVGVEDPRKVVRHFRAPGTHLPGIMVAGTFRANGFKDLWMVGRAKEVLVIELHDQKYRHLVVQVEDPHAATEALRAAINRER